jgi:hypothetical protein
MLEVRDRLLGPEAAELVVRKAVGKGFGAVEHGPTLRTRAMGLRLTP